MELYRILFNTLCFVLVDSLIVDSNISKISENSDRSKFDLDNKNDTDIDNVFNGVYTECFMHLSYICLQKKTLLYLKELNKLSEVPVIGNYVKFVKLNERMSEERNSTEDPANVKTSKELSFLIDKSVDNFFNNYIIHFSIMGRNISVSHTVDEFVGRKRRKGGGGGGGGGGGHGGGDDGGKKKMMMMAMMCMKMKLMMMVPAMMGMMGMMSFKGMMLSMMSFMIAKMMLLMKILEKKGGGGAGGGGGVDGGWAAGGGGSGAWMPAGGQDYAGGGGGGGYDANAQWQSRSILENVKGNNNDNYPMISYAEPFVRYNHIINDKEINAADKVNAGIFKVNDSDKPKSRNKRSIMDIIQNSYLYWMNKILGINNNRRTNMKYPKFKIVNGVKYIFQPYRVIQKLKPIKEQVNLIKTTDDGFRPIITAEDFNKGEIVEGSVESRMNKKKFNKMKDSVNDTMDDNPWE